MRLTILRRPIVQEIQGYAHVVPERGQGFVVSAERHQDRCASVIANSNMSACRVTFCRS